MRDKARIRKFCDAFAELWEEKAPDMRFGQMIVCLNKAADAPRHDIFNLEENEMIEVIRRYFSKEYKKSMQDKAELRDDLADRWKKMIDQLQHNDKSDEFDLQSFKILFVDTWQYFIDTLDDFGINNADLPIIGCISAFTYRSSFGRCIKNSKFYACMVLAKALLLGLEQPLYGRVNGGFYNGYLFVEKFERVVSEVHISNFESYFNELSTEFQNAEGQDYKEKSDIKSVQQIRKQ